MTILSEKSLYERLGGDSGIGQVIGGLYDRLLARTKAAITPVSPEPPLLALFAGYLHGLTEREREVLQLVVLGKNNSEIAAELFISINTVTRHLTNIFAKTNTRNRVEAAVYAARRRLV